jgi:hypothetical protein
MSSPLRSLLVALLGMLAASGGVAHPLNWTRVSLIKFEDPPARMVANIEVDLAKYVGGYAEYYRLASDPAAEAVLCEAATRALADLSVRVGGRHLSWQIDECIAPSDQEDFFSALPAPMCFIRATVRLPAGYNETSPTLSISSQTRLELPVVLRTTGSNTNEPLLLSAGTQAALFSQPNASRDTSVGRMAAWHSIASTYLVQGFKHILPLGFDHILFVVGLYFAGAHLRELLIQISAFTAAHTLTLGAATLGWVALPQRPVEVLIALSILWLAVENLRGLRPSRLRYGIVFAFGLVHGLGFAGALSEIGLPRDALLPSLLFFNLGVELGQLAVLCSAFLAVGWWRRSPRYHKLLVQPASVLIGLTATWWTVHRIIS